MNENRNTIAQLKRAKPFLWSNPMLKSVSQRDDVGIGLGDMQEAVRRLQRFAPLLEALFSELEASGGLIESPLMAAPGLEALLRERVPGFQGQLYIKGDHQLPVAGSIKARGGIYEVLCFAETLALGEGLVKEGDSYLQLLTPEVREHFGRYRVAVGSTGNLGLSIGVMASALGFKAAVHMSVEAKEWKKERLRSRGVEVVEHRADYSQAVKAGRAMAQADPYTYFVDDENSLKLFLGYSVAALRLQQQLKSAAIPVDAEHPLFVYLPCGVGGAPGGICFGLKQLFGDAVHCFFAEPVQAPSVLYGLAGGADEAGSVLDLGLRIDTEADGLAVGTASDRVCRLIRERLSGVFTVEDDALFRWLYQAKQQENLNLEPSAAAGFDGPGWLCGSAEGRHYTEAQGLRGKMAQATHLVWTTGGLFVPDEEFQRFYRRGLELCCNESG